MRPTFEDYLKSLSPVAPAAALAEPEALELCVRMTAMIASLDPLDRKSLSSAVASDPQVLPVLAAAAGQSQERFKTWLQSRFGTAGWITLGRKRAFDLIAAMDEDLGLLDVLTEQVAREWTWADVLARVMAPRQRAGHAVQQGRDLEDEVEQVIRGTGLSVQPRTRFEGAGQETAPADFAMPDGGSDALIAIAVKGFDSTGSKLTDARREIEEMAKVRRPTQFIFAVVDGHGWLRRQNDLRQIHRLWEMGRIDGLYSRVSLDDFGAALRAAARRLDLVE
jgi:hypothetical protein